MKYRRLGNTDIQISEIGFGAWTIALDWWGKKIDESEAKRMIKKAYDCGINFFETADMYEKEGVRGCWARPWRAYGMML